MNVKKRINTKAMPTTKIKNTVTSYGGPNQAQPIKNAVAMKPESTGYSVPKNSVTCNDELSDRDD